MTDERHCDVVGTLIMKIKSNTTNKDLPWRYGPYQRPSSEENETTSSSGSCHGSD